MSISQHRLHHRIHLWLGHLFTEKVSEFLQISGICNWERLFPVIAFANGLMLLVQLRALLPVHHFTNIVGAIGACLLLVGIAIYYRLLGELFRSTKGFSLHFAMWSMCMGFSLLVMCVLYLDLFLDQFGASPSLQLAPALAFSVLSYFVHDLFQNKLY